MYLIEIRVENNRFVKCESLFAGNIGENDVTKLKFVVPKEYESFYKYLDIILSDGTKTQTVVGDLENNVFYYTIPYSLSENKELTLQLIMKKDNKIFKSNIFTLYFNEGISATQVLLGDYQDTIQYIMENKLDNKEAVTLNNKVNIKLDKSEFYNYYNELNNNINTKVSENEYLEFKESNRNIINSKVDKIHGKQLSEENFTAYLKNKLNGIEEGAEVNPTNVSELNNDMGYLTKHQSLDNYATKDEVNNKVISKADKSYVDEKIATINQNISSINNLKADISYVDNKIALAITTTLNTEV